MPLPTISTLDVLQQGGLMVVCATLDIFNHWGYVLPPSPSPLLSPSPAV